MTQNGSALTKPGAQQVAAPPKANTLRGFLELRAAHFAELLPKSSAFTADKLIKLALLAAKRDSNLEKCGMDSVFSCLLQVAELGLDPSGGVAGQAYLVPYGTVCTLIIGYRGYIELARRSGLLKQIESHVVHEHDKFTLKYGYEPVLVHEPVIERDKDPGKAVLAYCIARLADSAIHVEHMTFREIEKIRQGSKLGNKGPWVDHWEEQARKTVIRRTMKYLPLSAELQKAMEIEDEQEAGGSRLIRAVDVSPALSPNVRPEPAALPSQTTIDGESINTETGEVLDAVPRQAEPPEQRQEARAEAQAMPPTSMQFEELVEWMNSAQTREELQKCSALVNKSKANGQLRSDQVSILMETYKAKMKSLEVRNG